MATLTIAGCDDAQQPEESLIVRPMLSTAIVSDPVTGPAGTAGISRSGTDAAGIVFVSLPPGTIPDAREVTIRSPRTGDTLTVPMLDGGFDPVAVAAAVGDTLDLDILVAGADRPLFYAMVVPGRRPPVVVRSDPPPRKRDVPLNATLRMVFSEPIDIAGLTQTAIELRRGATRVAGRLESTDPAGLVVAFVPETALVSGTQYYLVVSSAVRDLDGDSLAAPMTVAFVTASDAALHLGFSMQPALKAIAGVSGTPSIRVAAQLGSGRTATGYTGNISLVIGTGPAGARLSGTTTRTAVGGVAAFTDVTISPAGTGYRLVATADGLPAVASRSFEIAAPPGEIAFVGGAPGSSEIFVMNADGSSITRVVAGDDPTWSPDGGRVAFTSYASASAMSICEGRITVMNADGSGLTELASGAQPAWSPDGARIAYTACTEKRFDIFVMTADGSDVAPLNERIYSGTPPWAAYPAWSPDGRSIAFSASPDPDMEPSRIHVVALDGTPAWTYTGAGSFAAECCPAWSPDGGRIVYWNFLEGLRIMTANRGDGGAFGAREAFVWSRPGWSSDGSWMVYAGPGGIYVATADDAWHARIADQGRSPMWRPRQP